MEEWVEMRWERDLYRVRERWRRVRREVGGSGGIGRGCLVGREGKERRRMTKRKSQGDRRATLLFALTILPSFVQYDEFNFK